MCLRHNVRMYSQRCLRCVRDCMRGVRAPATVVMLWSLSTACRRPVSRVIGSVPCPSSVRPSRVGRRCLPALSVCMCSHHTHHLCHCVHVAVSPFGSGLLFGAGFRPLSSWLVRVLLASFPPVFAPWCARCATGRRSRSPLFVPPSAPHFGRPRCRRCLASLLDYWVGCHLYVTVEGCLTASGCRGSTAFLCGWPGVAWWLVAYILVFFAVFDCCAF